MCTCLMKFQNTLRKKRINERDRLIFGHFNTIFSIINRIRQKKKKEKQNSRKMEI